MQKNNCKLKTIFKKGLSFSIALALGAAATSLNLAKTAEAAAPVVGGARTVYLAGEKADFTSGWTQAPTHYSVDGANWKAINEGLVLSSNMSKVEVADSDAGGNKIDYNFTVYDWAKIYTGTSVKAENKAAHDAARDAIVDALTLDIPTSKNADVAAISGILKTGELQTTDGTKIDNVDYAKHNGKDVQIKLPAANNNLVCKLGALEVTRKITKLVLSKGPSEDMYVAGDHIKFDGLTLLATYDDGQTGEINWTEDSKKSFIAKDGSGTVVEEGAAITKTIKDIRVSYKDPASGDNIEVPDDDADKFVLYFCTDKSLGNKDTVSIKGVFTEDAAVTSIVLDENSDEYKKLNAAFDKNAKVIAAYDVVLSFEGSIGAYRVSFNVGKNYAGQVVTVKHLASDKIETFVTTVDADGIVTIQTSSLSPFMIVLGATEEDKAAAAETEKKNAEAAATQEAAKAEAAKASSTAAASNAASKSASSSVKTGDASVVAFSVFGFVALISAAVLAFMKKNRKNFEK